MAAVSVIITPRERYSSIVATLEDLYRTIHPDTPVIVVEGGSPPQIRRKLQQMRDKYKFLWLHEENPILPNRARNLGLAKTSTEYVVFVDNDILFEPEWLDHLVSRAEKDQADVVAPMICIGPPRAHLIHHAGGTLTVTEENGVPIIKEAHRLMNVPIENFSEHEAPPENEVCEFHCALVRRDLFDRIGQLDERLITREQMDFALRCKLANARVRFEKRAIATYNAKVRFEGRDLEYHLFRWSDELAVRSLVAFEQSWKTELDKERIRFRWIESHRRQAIVSTYPLLKKIRRNWREKVIRFLEKNATSKGILSSYECYVPPQPGFSAAELVASRSGP